MASLKISDGIRKKIAPRTAPQEMIQEEPRCASPKTSSFLAHWQDDQRAPDRRGVQEYADDDIPSGGENREDDSADTQVPAGARVSAAVSWSEIDEPPLSPAPRRRLQSILSAFSLRGLKVLSVDSRARMARWGMAAGGAALIAGAIFLSTGGASLTVSFKPRVEDVALQDIAVVFDTSAGKVLSAQKVIPAEALSFSKKLEQSFAATGKKQIAERAQGKAVITNRFSSSSQTLVAGTRFLTDAGILFRLPKSVTVPGAKIEEGKIAPQSVEVELVADAPGERSNITGSVALKIPGFEGTPKYDGFFATAVQGFSGGIQGEASVVSADDLKKAQEQVTKALVDGLKNEIGMKIPPGFAAIKELQIVEITKVAAPAVGTRAEQFAVSASAVGKAIVFREEDAIALAGAFVLADARDQELVADSVRLQYRVRSIDFDKGRADMTITGAVKTKAVVHRDELAVLLAGKKGGSIADVLRSRPEIASFNLSLFPPWRASAPSDPSRIRFQSE